MLDEGAECRKASFVDNDALSDITLRVGGTIYPAHRVILSWKSQRFHEMFQSSFLDPSDREVDLDEDGDDPQALFGLLTWCYGLFFNGAPPCESAFNVDPERNPCYYGRSDDEHLRYIANLYVTADKYKIPALKSHARKNFADAVQVMMTRREMLDEGETDKLASMIQRVAECVYHRLGDNSKELRSALVRAVDSKIDHLLRFKNFTNMMWEVPEFSSDLLASSRKEVRRKDAQAKAYKARAQTLRRYRTNPSE